MHTWGAINRHVRCTWGQARMFSHSAKRKELIPLIKCLHPDLMMHHVEAVKKTNMNCIQNLNDLWDTLESNVQATVGKNVAYGLDIKVPFRNQYDLTCYLNDDTKSTQAGSDAPVKQYPVVVYVPEALCRRQSISHKVFMSSIDLILLQQGRLFEAAGLGNPWKESEALREVSEMPLVEGQRPAEELSSELETRLFERWLIKNSKLSGMISRFDRKGRTNYSRVFSAQHSRNSASMDRMLGNRRAQDAMFADEVDYYLKAGNVVVSPMSAQEEFASVKQLRKFFIDYGDVLNFGTARWYTVYVMLHGYSGAEKFQSKARLDKIKRRAADMEKTKTGKEGSVGATSSKRATTIDTIAEAGSPRPGKKSESDSARRPSVQSSSQEGHSADGETDEGEEGDAEGGKSGVGSVAAPVYYAGKNDGSDNGGYAVESHGPHHLVRVPAAFKPNELLEFMRKVLPAARIDLT